MIGASCFVRGTRLRTVGGDIPVEDLVPGQHLLLAADGRMAAIAWGGYVRVEPRRHRTPEEAAPVVFQVGALADRLPSRTLTLSPDHGILLGGVLVPARLLANGASIRQDLQAVAVDYVAIELDRHDIVFAEGVPVESYLESGSRSLFAPEVATLPANLEMAAERVETAYADRGVAPRCLSGPGLAAIRAPLLQRAAQLGHIAAHDPDLHLMVAGRRIGPLAWRDGRAVFVLPPGTTEVQLCSNSGVPAEHAADSGDRRVLGVAVSSLASAPTGGVLAEIDLADPLLADGFHPLEGDTPDRWRWTGRTALLQLPPALAEGGCLEVAVRMVHPHWSQIDVLPKVERAA